MSREEQQLLLHINMAQQLAIHYVRNASYKPECCWLGKERDKALIDTAQHLIDLLDASVGEQHNRAEAYAIHHAD